MDKLILKDQTELGIEEGYTISRLVTYVNAYADLEGLAAKLTRDNLADVKRLSGATDLELEAHQNMAIISPMFKVEPVGNRVQVTFGLRPLTEEELKAPAIATAAAYLSDEQALTVKALYPLYQGLIGATVPLGTRFTYEGMLYKTIQDNLLIQEQYVPGEGTESLYVCLDGIHAGTLADPIPWKTNMQPEAGKYYVEGEMVAKCIEDPGQPLYNALAELCPGRYFEVAEG